MLFFSRNSSGGKSVNVSKFHVSDCVFTAMMSKLFAALVTLSIAYFVQGKAAMFCIATSRLIVKCTMGHPVTPKSTML